MSQRDLTLKKGFVGYGGQCNCKDTGDIKAIPFEGLRDLSKRNVQVCLHEVHVACNGFS